MRGAIYLRKRADFAEHFDPVFVVKQELTMNRHKNYDFPKKVKRFV